jgi:hypothetical protein
LDSKKQSQGIYNKVAFAPFDLLSSVKPAGFLAFLGAFRALAIQDADARRSCPWGTIGMGRYLPHLVSQGVVHFLDDAAVAPLPVVFEHLFPRWKIMWEIPPLASSPFAVEDRIHDNRDMAFNGKYLPDSQLIELLPGEHKVSFRKPRTFGGEEAGTVTFSAEAGGRYRFSYTPNGNPAFTIGDLGN